MDTGESMMESSLEAKGPGRSRSGCVFFPWGASYFDVGIAFLRKNDSCLHDLEVNNTGWYDSTNPIYCISSLSICLANHRKIIAQRPIRYWYFLASIGISTMEEGQAHQEVLQSFLDQFPGVFHGASQLDKFQNILKSSGCPYKMSPCFMNLGWLSTLEPI